MASRLRPRCLELADDRNGVLRLWPDGVVRVDICRPDPSVLVDDVASRHRQPKVGLVVQLVERVAERRVELLQIRWKREREPEGLGHAEVEVGQDVELELRAPAHDPPVLRHLRRERNERGAQRSKLWPDRLQSFDSSESPVHPVTSSYGVEKNA